MSGSAFDAAGELHVHVRRHYAYVHTFVHAFVDDVLLGLLGLRCADDTRDNDNDETRTHTTATGTHRTALSRYIHYNDNRRTDGCLGGETCINRQ